MPVAPRHHPRGGCRGARQGVAFADRVEAIGHPYAATVLLAPDGEHHLGGCQRPCVGPGVRQRLQPALGRQVEAFDDPGNGVLRCGAGAAEVFGAQELLHRVLVVTVRGQQRAVRGAQRPDARFAAALQAFEQVLAEARVTAHAAPVGWRTM